MGHRLSKIYTRTGDKGTTGLGDGSRVDKDHARVEVIGAVDELNSVLGLLLSETLPGDTRAFVTTLQHQLFDLGGELCIPGRIVLKDDMIAAIETELDRMNARLPKLKEFILPGGTHAASLAHLARAVCRRSERRLYTLKQAEYINPAAMRYLNRLSDYLFVLARHLNKTAREPDVLWQPGRSAKAT